MIRQRSEFFEMPQANNEIKFERRNSDSDFVLDRRSSTEKVNLAEEIKKLSARLMMLSSINTDLKDMHNPVTFDQNSNELNNTSENFQKTQLKSLSGNSSNNPVKSQKTNPITTTTSNDQTILKPILTNDDEFLKRMDPSIKPVIKEKPEFLKNRTRSKMQEIFEKSLNSSNHNYTNTSNFQQSRTFTRASSVSHESRCVTENVFGNSFEGFGALSRINRGALFDRLQLLEDMPKLQPKLANLRNPLETITTSQRKMHQSSTIESESSSISKQSNVPWVNHQNSSRRTKFRVSHMSRDVPIGSPDTHQNIFLEESITATKDCLLNLLDKYGDTTECQTAVTHNVRQTCQMEGRDNNVGQRSMNSLNFFFQRHATMGKTVKQMQAQLESKTKS